jgi:prophage tail gpP-like protein
MGPELVTVLANGAPWTAFRRVMVRASFKEAARSFHLDIAAEPGASATNAVFRAGTSIDILFNGVPVLRGYVDRKKPHLNEHDKAEIAVSGRAKAQDMIDSSAVHATGFFKNKTPLEILQALDQFGVGVKSRVPLDKVPFYQLTPGESVFRAGEKLCRRQAVWMVGQPDGSVMLDVAGAGRHAPLLEGVNCKVIEADHDWSGRHSKVIVRGQRPYGHGKDALEIEAVAADSAVGRNRPVIVVEDGDTDRTRAGKRARHRRDREAGNGLKANVTVQGFRDDGGVVWTPGFIVYFESPFADIAQDMAIETVTFEQVRDGGSTTTIELVDPRALGGEGRKGGKAGGEWKTDAGDPALPSPGSQVG